LTHSLPLPRNLRLFLRLDLQTLSLRMLCRHRRDDPPRFGPSGQKINL